MATDEILIDVQGLGKRYIVQPASGGSRLGDKLARLLPFAGRGVRREAAAAAAITPEFWALRGIDLQVRRGEVLAILGRNGSGKSTLLKILSGITTPTEGLARIAGTSLSLLEAGVGFSFELTGRQNVMLNAAILGADPKAVEARLDAIIDFAEVRRFIDMPIKWYSTGMIMRLAFSTAIHLDEDIMFIDEVLAVGDAGFQEKCYQQLHAAKAAGRTILIVSHQTDALVDLCDRGIVLHEGRTAFAGPIADSITWYKRDCA